MKNAYDVSVVFQSLSKRSNMTAYRIGWICGNEETVTAFKKLKTNIDSGAPWFLQEAAVSALRDETHVEKIRNSYAQKKKILQKALKNCNLQDCDPQATFYIWQRCPKKYTSIEFTKKLLEDELAIVTVPGSMISKSEGDDYVRFALVPDIESIKIAAELLESIQF